MRRVGVFICHCGTNIAAGIDIARVVEAAQELPGVVMAMEYKYMCSEPGQVAVKEAIKEHSTDGFMKIDMEWAGKILFKNHNKFN